MAMQKMTLGRRISIGFGILVVITLALGGMGVYNMRNAATNSEKLSNMYAPEALVARTSHGLPIRSALRCVLLP